MNKTSRKGDPNPKAKMGPMKKGANKVSKKKPYEATKEYLSLLSEMLVNPAECTEIVRTPADFAMVGDVKCFTRTFQLKATDVDSGSFALTVTPSITNFFSVTASEALTLAVPGRGTGQLTAVEGPDAEYYLSGSIDLWPIQNPVEPPRHAISSQRIGGKIGYAVTAPVGTNFWTAFYAPPNVIPAPIQVLMFNSANNTWTNTGQFIVGPAKDYIAFVVPAGFTLGAIAFESVKGVTNIDIDVVPPPGASFTQDAHLAQLYDSDAVLLGRVERYRVTALSLLATYSGNFLNNGGVIAAARTQPKYSYNDVPYSALTKLQDHKYQGPIVDGAYCWWMPYSYEEMDYRTDVLAPADATQLRVAGEFADDNGALVITVCAVVEFYSPLQIFSHEPGPFSSDEYLELLHALDKIPAATCNPGHRELFSAIWDKGLSVARQGVGYLIEHPEIVAKMAALFLA